jgi:hypothetical protein
MVSFRPFLASILALFWLAAPLTAELHFLLVEHSVCPEHGELTEEGSHSLEGVQHQDAHEHVSGPVLASTSVLDDGHDHGCGFLLPPSPNVGGDIALLVRPSVLNFPSLHLNDAGAPRAPPLSFAPKTSPPLS